MLFIYNKEWDSFKLISFNSWLMKKVERVQLVRLLCVVMIHCVVQAEREPFLINCGVNSTASFDVRVWVGDLAPNNDNLTLSFPGFAASTTSNFSGESMYETLYTTARFFDQTVNYTFKVKPGNYYLRLHFYPFSYENHDVNDSLFTVWANDVKLVSDFSVTAQVSSTSILSLLKEYFLTVVSSGGLVIKFVPNDETFAFVNAIEVIPVLNEMFVDAVSKVGANGERSSSINWGQGIETMYRLNVGGPVIKSNSDQQLWRRWESDLDYMFTSYAGAEIKNTSNMTYASANDSSIAPLLVYETARTMTNNEVLEKRFNMSWKFNVDPDFDYLVRLHFCELVYKKPNQRIFRIYINNRTAAENFDVFVRAGGMEKAYHQDYIDVVTSEVSTLWIQLGPDTSAASSGTDALLNGLEIFKMSRNMNLAHVSNRYGVPTPKQDSGKTTQGRALWVGIGAGISSIAVITAFCTLLFCYCGGRNKMASTKDHPPALWCPLFLHETTTSASTPQVCCSKVSASIAATSRIGRQFTFLELRVATNNFDESLVIGVGGFGKVYKGVIDDGSLVAIKRANPQSEQGLAEFETEIEMLSKLRHRHLVSIIGFCDELNEMILVYEYMAKGTLRSHLFGSELPPLTWKQRLDICIGSARGIHYLHTGAERGIIHRDVKTTNILLDDSFVAKVADFGLSKTGPAFDRTHVSTAVKGSFGYLDPEYFRRQQLTEKSDVYSFGVVLFEVVCARPVINPSLPREQINLAEWVMRWQQQGLLETIVDSRLQGNYTAESFKKFGEIAEKCLSDEGKNRPTMGEVLWHLEYILQLHEASMCSINSADHTFTGSGQIPANLELQQES